MDDREVFGPDGLPLAPSTVGKVLCCMCGAAITPNAATMCITCIQDQEDITAGIPKQVVVHQCRGCLRYNRPPWVVAERDSRELLAMCLKKLNGLNKVKLIDAAFQWTEPHSKRIRVKLTIEKEVVGVKLRRWFEVEYVVGNMQCPDCARSFTDHTWKCMVQVRQKVAHKKTFLYLEQVILKHNAHMNCTSVEQAPAGIDFGYLDRSRAMKFVEFLSTVVPTKYKSSKKLISSDIKSNNHNFKFTLSVEIVPICKEDYICLPKKLSSSLGSISPLVLCYRVSNLIYVVDPLTLQIAEISAEKYWKYPFTPILTPDRLIEYTVLDIKPVPVPVSASKPKVQKKKPRGKRRRRQLAKIDEDADVDDALSQVGDTGAGGERIAGGDADGGASTLGGRSRARRRRAAKITSGASAVSAHSGAGGWAARSVGGTSTITGGPKGKYLLAEAEVARTRDLGENDTRFTVLTHLGNVLKPGDSVMGYDLTTAIFNDSEMELPRGVRPPEAVLVRKVYNHRKKGRGRAWKLRKMEMRESAKEKVDEEQAARDYEDFLQQVEDDPLMRRNIQIFKDKDALPAAAMGEEATGDDEESGGAADPTYPGIQLHEMLDELTLADAGGDGKESDLDSVDSGRGAAPVAPFSGEVPDGANPFADYAPSGAVFESSDASPSRDVAHECLDAADAAEAASRLV